MVFFEHEFFQIGNQLELSELVWGEQWSNSLSHPLAPDASLPPSW